MVNGFCTWNTLNQCIKKTFLCFKNIVLVISIIKTYHEWMTTNLKYFFHSVTSHSNLHSYFKYADIARRKLNTFLSKQISFLLKAKEFLSTKTMPSTMCENRFKSKYYSVDVAWIYLKILNHYILLLSETISQFL